MDGKTDVQENNHVSTICMDSIGEIDGESLFLDWSLTRQQIFFPFFHKKKTRQSTERMAMVLILPSSLTVNGEKNGPPAKIAESTFESSRSPRHGCVCVCVKRFSLSLSVRKQHTQGTVHSYKTLVSKNVGSVPTKECDNARDTDDKRRNVAIPMFLLLPLLTWDLLH